MSSTTKRAGGAYHARYSYEVDPECAYCGEPSQGRDHIPPLRFAGSELDLPRGARWMLVGACRECNSILGARPLLTLGARRTFLIERYTKRYGKLIDCPAWNMDEIMELGRGLQTAVMVQEAERRRAIRRMRRLKERAP